MNGRDFATLRDLEKHAKPFVNLSAKSSIMQLTCDRVLFSAAFQAAASAVPARTPKDVLRNVYIHLGSGGVELVGTDQEVAIRFT